MVKLAMASRDAHLDPSIPFNQGNEFTDLHRQSLPSSLDDPDTQSSSRRLLRAWSLYFAIVINAAKMSIASHR
jgi:hypothetical protein